mgnify:CR=1 FL=1
MAKKSVASLQTGSKRLTKAIKMVKKQGSNSYSFVETIISPDLASEWLGKQGSWDMSYEGTFGDSGYGAKAQQVLGQVRGARFQHEKNKRKKSYFGGAINDTAVNSIKFADSDDE